MGPELEPEYVWFNGTATHYLLGDKVDDDAGPLNRLFGSYDDPDAQDRPGEGHRARQPFDEENRTLIQPKLRHPRRRRRALARLRLAALGAARA